MSKNEMIMLPREVVEQALEALSNTGTQRGKRPSQFLAEGLSINALRAALEQPQRKLTQQGIADSALLGNIESPFNACMHQEHCKRWKAQFDQRHQVDPSSDKDLQSKTGNLATGITASVPKGWKLVPVEPKISMKQAALNASRRWAECDAPLPRTQELWASEVCWKAMVEAAPQPPVLDQTQAEQEPYLYYDPESGDTWTQEAIDDGLRQSDGLIALYTK